MKDQLYYALTDAAGKTPEEKMLLDDNFRFLIDTNYIAMVDNGTADPECRRQLISFLTAKKQWKRIEDVWEKICSLPKPPHALIFDDSLIEKLRNDSVFRFHSDKYQFDFPTRSCLNLTEAITLTKGDFIDRDFFDYFFAFRFSKVSINRVRDFLSFCFQVHFNRDIREFTHFLQATIITKHSELVGHDKISLLKSIFENEEQTANGTSIDNAKYPFYYYCLISGKDMPLWEDGKKMDYLHSLADKHTISKNSFYNSFLEIEKGKKKPKEADIKALLEMLSKYPKSLKVLKDKLINQ